MDCEVKVLVGDEHWDQVKNRIPDGSDDKKREVWFFETPDLVLKQHEVVLRARLNRKKKTSESTTKWRRWVSPYVPVLDAWNGIQGFKAEVDATLSEGVPAWSITREDLEENTFEAARTSTEKLFEFFGDEQLLLVRSAWPQIPWKKVTAYGPIASVKWGIEDSVSIERWTIQGESIIEVSKRGDDQAESLQEILDWLRAAGVEGAALPGGKTAWALERLVHAGTP